ncbi:hypothetical protein ACWEX2_13405 [Staphylococcus xylosus]|uniref:Transmembrane protein n=1 Tax=Staphylococcus xylosus TaxID=1288 RepID=A0AAQ0LVL9_STAXY|nr:MULTISPECIES: hypothetical protein [Staphylococcus]RIL91053.1 hypothetical protein BUY32_04920 [Staphylococcus cohnii]RIM90627.1 hypothetical protein BU104_13455 [Staphylococcus xylosus]
MLSNRLENMSDDLSKNHNVDDYLEEIQDENKDEFFKLAIDELNDFINTKSQNIMRIFTSIFIVAGLISISLTLWFLPMINDTYQKENILHQGGLNYELKHMKHSDNPTEKIQDGVQELQNNSLKNPENSKLIFYVLGAGLLVSLFAYILPIIFLSFNRVSLKKYKALLLELKEQRYIHLSKSNDV